MRSDKQMLNLILETAMTDDRIRIVIMNGSRANPESPRDIFMDFDIVYLVTDPAPFHRNLEWIRRFGELMILQMPDEMGDTLPEDNERFTYLMQFMDGNRIDLSICPLDMLDDVLRSDLSLVLLDKDELIPSFDLVSQSIYYPNPPDAKSFSDSCNEFWWVSTYVAKGLWRREIIYARDMFDRVMRVELMKMLVWYIGGRTSFKRNLGKSGKYFQKYLEPELWDLLINTYSGAGYQQTWQALLTMCDLFRKAALFVGEQFGFQYPHEDDRRVSEHLHHVRSLPPDAQEMY